MKYIITFFGVLLMYSCQQKKSDTAESTSSVQDSITQEFIKENHIQFGHPKKQQIAQSIKVKGVVEVPPNSRVVINAKTDGYVRMINFLEGDFVRKGSQIAVIENPSLLEKQTQLRSIQAQLQHAKIELNRKQTLYKSQATSLKSLQEAQSQVAVLSESSTGLQRELAAVGSSINAGGMVSINAPYDGEIAKIFVSNGTYINNQNPIAELINTKEMHVTVEIPAKYAYEIKTGLPIDVKVGKQNFKGSIINVSPEIDEQKKTVLIHCHLNDHSQEKMLKPNAVVSVVVYLGEEEAWTLPKTAVIEEGNNFYGIEKNKNKVEKISLNGGRYEGEYYILPDSSMVEKEFVTEGVYYLR